MAGLARRFLITAAGLAATIFGVGSTVMAMGKKGKEQIPAKLIKESFPTEFFPDKKKYPHFHVGTNFVTLSLGSRKHKNLVANRMANCGNMKTAMDEVRNLKMNEQTKNEMLNMMADFKKKCCEDE